MRLRTVEELVGSVVDDDWHNQPRWKRIPSLEAGAWVGIHGRRGSLAGMQQSTALL